MVDAFSNLPSNELERMSQYFTQESFEDKQKIIKQLFQKEKLITSKLNLVEKKNRLLTEVIDTDYLEILYRKKFMVGKSNEHIYKNN